MSVRPWSLRLCLLLVLGFVGCRAGQPDHQAPAVRPPVARPQASQPPAPVTPAGFNAEWLESVDATSSVRLAVVRVNPRRLRLRVVVDEPVETWRMAAEVADDLDALAVINGGYFDETNQPLGLLIADGRVRNPLRQADWGVFWVRGDDAAIVHTRDYPGPDGIDQAIQCGPRLVVDGHPTRLKASTPAARSAIGLDAAGRVLLIASQGGLSLAAFAEWLAQPVAEGGVGCVDAMNLDGGPSTQLAVPGVLEVLGAYPMPSHLVVLSHAAVN